MHKSLSLGAIAVLVGVGIGLANPPVELQPTTPGTQQFGHLNVSGSVLAGNVSATNSATNAQVVSGLASATTGATYGGLFRAASPAGRAVRGFATARTGAGVGGDFQSDGPTGFAVKGVATATTGKNFGVYGKSSSAEGFAGFFQGNVEAIGALTVNGDSELNGALKVEPPGGGNAIVGTSSSTGYGVSGTGLVGGSFSTNWSGGAGIAVTSGHPGSPGVAIAANTSPGPVLDVLNVNSSGAAHGGQFVTYSADAIGVLAVNHATIGTNQGGRFESKSVDGRGVIGYASAASGMTYGLRGTASSPSGFGVYSAGNFGVSGSKAFRIDHPFDPANKYLMHYCAEGPKPQLVYNGRIVTDEKGYAWIQLPDYFTEVNKDPLYQLTVLDRSDDFVQAKVTREIVDNQFQIRTSKPGVEVCWEVKATRNDAWVRAHGAPVEVEKTGLERGKYQHPGLYRKSPELGIDYFPDAVITATKFKPPKHWNLRR